MNDENDRPNDKCEQASGKSNKHQPIQHSERIKKLAIVMIANDAGMHRAFINAATVCVSNYATCHHRPHRRKREQNDQDKENPINNPRETLPNG